MGRRAGCAAFLALFAQALFDAGGEDFASAACRVKARFRAGLADGGDVPEGAFALAAAAAGEKRGGFASVGEAVRALGWQKDTVYNPIPEHVAVYDRLFAEYRRLHDYFGRENDVMKRLRVIHAGEV